jgi:hypothetical protein
MNRMVLPPLVYMILMNVVAVCVMIVEAIVYLTKLLISGQSLDLDALLEYTTQRIAESGWSYIVAILVGVAIVCL